MPKKIFKKSNHYSRIGNRNTLRNGDIIKHGSKNSYFHINEITKGSKKKAIIRLGPSGSVINSRSKAFKSINKKNNI